MKKHPDGVWREDEMFEYEQLIFSPGCEARMTGYEDQLGQTFKPSKVAAKRPARRPMATSRKEEKKS
jgi:hypothetical protein